MTASRLCAFKILYRCEKDGAFSNILLSAAQSDTTLSDADRRLVTEIVHGTLERKLTLDFVISKLVSRAADKLDIPVKVILEMSLYQLMYLDGVPVHAACDEAVRLAKKFTNKGAAGFVNAVLRSYLRIDSFDFPENDTPYGLSVNFSVSQDVAGLLAEQYGVCQAVEMLNAAFEQSGVTVTMNSLKGEKAGTVHFDKMTSQLSKMLSEGRAFVQDASAAQAVELLAPEENDAVIDVCAAPGGKSLKAAMMMNGKGSILSLDLHQNKLSLIDDLAKRLGVQIIKTAQNDATVPDPNLYKSADKVICDVPCTGIGVIGKKPEIRYKSLAQCDVLYATQEKILAVSAEYLKKGGKLLYSTCTLNKRENEEQVQRFLLQNKNFKLIEEKTQFITRNHDGFYMAVLLND